MAIGITDIKDSGVTVTYVRISGIDIDLINNVTLIELDEYLDENYRQRAKDSLKIRNSINDLRNKSENSIDKDLRNSLDEKVMSLTENNFELLNNDYSFDKTIVRLDYIPDVLSIESLYKELCKLDKYSNSKMV